MKIKLLSILLLLLFLGSCGGVKKSARYQRKQAERGYATERQGAGAQLPDLDELPNPLDRATPNFESDVVKYIYLYNAVAMEEMGTYGIPASITLAQGILESDSGRSPLTQKSNNHFGIKCHDWTGPSVRHNDDFRKECFRKYKNPNYSFRDHSLFLRDRARYSRLFELPIDDYKAWARGLKSAGYATDPAYPRKLISIIERYELYQYDQKVIQLLKNGKTQSAQKTTAVENERGAVNRYTVQKGDTLYGIAKRFGITVEELKTKNGLKDNTLSIGQQLRL